MYGIIQYSGLTEKEIKIAASVAITANIIYFIVSFL